MDSMFSIVNGVRYYNLALAQRKVAELKEAGESVLWIFNGKMQAESRIFFNAKEMAVPVRQVRHQEECPKGGSHEWGIDGAHSNHYCKKCFVSKEPEGE